MEMNSLSEVTSGQEITFKFCWTFALCLYQVFSQHCLPYTFLLPLYIPRAIQTMMFYFLSFGH